MRSRSVFPATGIDVLPAPACRRPPSGQVYQPVDCEFTDELEHISVLKIRVDLDFYSLNLEKHTAIGVLIADIVIKDKAEFLVLSDGQNIRLDYLIEFRITK